jgi:acetyltransferase-like isoleucine patch superfamily enzyme
MTSLIDRWRLRRELKRQLESKWLREHFDSVYRIRVGMYSYGCFDVRRIPRDVTIGRYCSFSQTCWLLNANHVLDYLSLHPYLYNPALGVVASEPFERTKFVVEDDVWIGHNAVITASAARIGRGAVVAAGAVVTRNVEPYEVVAGVPARRLRMRFDADCIAKIEESKWWLMSKAELQVLVQSRSPMLFDPANYFAAAELRGATGS